MICKFVLLCSVSTYRDVEASFLFQLLWCFFFWTGGDGFLLTFCHAFSQIARCLPLNRWSLLYAHSNYGCYLPLFFFLLSFLPPQRFGWLVCAFPDDFDPELYDSDEYKRSSYDEFMFPEYTNRTGLGEAYQGNPMTGELLKK